MTSAELISEFEWTRDRHGGSVVHAAHILGMKPASLARRLYRLKKTGRVIRFTNDTQAHGYHNRWKKAA